MTKLYGLLVTAPRQAAPVREHCFGDCGKISIGGGFDTGAGPMMICTVEECPYMAEQTDEPIGRSGLTGEPIYLRALVPSEDA